MSRHPVPCLCWWWLPAITAELVIWPGCSNKQAEQRGEELFQHDCAVCHEVPNPELKKQPPRLEGLFQRKTLPSGARANDEQVRKTIIHGLGTMPAFEGRLSDEDVKNVLAYLHQLK